MSVSRAERLQQLGIVALLGVAVAGAIWAQVRITTRDLQIDYGAMVDVDDWRAANSMHYGPNVVTFAAPPTEAGLREAVRWQIETAQALSRVDGYDLWSLATCTHWDIHPHLDWEAAELIRIELPEFEGHSARTKVVYRDPDNPGTEFAARNDQSERWTWSDGHWTNQTCSYGLGPPVAWESIFGNLSPEEISGIMSVLDDFEAATE